MNKKYTPILIWILAIFTISLIGFYQHKEAGANSAKNNDLVSHPEFYPENDVRDLEFKENMWDNLHTITDHNKSRPSVLAKSSQTSSDKITRINTIQDSMVGKQVTIIAKITNRTDHTKGHVFLTLSDNSREVMVPIFSDKGIDTRKLTPGMRCRISGKVELYKGKFEIIPENQNDVQVVSSSEQQALPITENDVGKEVEITARVVTKYQHPQGHLFLNVLLSKTDQEILIPIFESMNYNPKHMKVNSIISVKGKVSVYKGQLQVVPAGATDIKVIQQGDEQESVIVGIDRISNNDTGQMVQVRGFVRGISTGKGHSFFNLEDKQGHSIKAVLFRADSEENIGRKLKLMDAETKGYPIRLLAMVNEYNGNLELVIDKVFNEY